MKPHDDPSFEVLVRPLKEKDIPAIAFERCPPWSTPEESKKRWDSYLQEQNEGKRTVGIVERQGEIKGYGSLKLVSEYPRFTDFPEISDVWVYEEFRGRGCATKLIAWLEALAKGKGYQQIGIGVGLYRDYGSAQKLYFHLGYCPDGYGITYKCQQTTPGETYLLDDELILWLTKPL